MKRRTAYICMIIAMVLSSIASAGASPRQETLAGPVRGEVLGILDGDTVSVRIQVWIGQALETSVRINGIDAPEMRGKCQKERDMAAAARNELARIIAKSPITLYNIRLEKYAGRVLANAATADGTDIAEHLISKGFVRAYHGKKRAGWCE